MALSVAYYDQKTWKKNLEIISVFVFCFLLEILHVQCALYTTTTTMAYNIEKNTKKKFFCLWSFREKFSKLEELKAFQNKSKRTICRESLWIPSECPYLNIWKGIWLQSSYETLISLTQCSYIIRNLITIDNISAYYYVAKKQFKNFFFVQRTTERRT